MSRYSSSADMGLEIKSDEIRHYDSIPDSQPTGNAKNGEFIIYFPRHKPHYFMIIHMHTARHYGQEIEFLGQILISVWGLSTYSRSAHYSSSHNTDQ